MNSLQGGTILSRTAPHALFVIAALVLSGVARSAAVAQARPLQSHPTSYTITTRVARATVVPAAQHVQLAFSAAPSHAADLEIGDAAMRVAPMRVVTRVTTRHVAVTLDPIIEFTPALAPGKKKTVRGAAAGMRVVTERVTMWDNVPVERVVVASTTVRAARAAYVLAGAPHTFAQLAASSPFRKLVRVYTMEATAYTAMTAKANPTGYTANGMLAKYGIVAVDPDVIPLGTHLFIPGYGLAIAADTGGAIIGHRIDLCMDRYGDAIRFGRQPVTVYVVQR